VAVRESAPVELAILASKFEEIIGALVSRMKEAEAAWAVLFAP